MSRRAVSLLVLLTLVFATGAACTGPRDLNEVTRFFRKGAFGMSPDYALLQRSVVQPNAWDHIATFYGNANDHAMCQDAAEFLASKLGYEFSCVQLNE